MLQMVPAEAVDIDEVEKSPWDDIFDSDANLFEISRLEQRLAQIDLQVSCCIIYSLVSFVTCICVHDRSFLTQLVNIILKVFTLPVIRIFRAVSILVTSN